MALDYCCTVVTKVVLYYCCTRNPIPSAAVSEPCSQLTDQWNAHLHQIINPAGDVPLRRMRSNQALIRRELVESVCY
jgi:hypothetical protein